MEEEATRIPAPDAPSNPPFNPLLHERSPNIANSQPRRNEDSVISMQSFEVGSNLQEVRDRVGKIVRRMQVDPVQDEEWNKSPPKYRLK